MPLPLTNFGSVTFVNASATAGGHTGSISDPAWAANAIALDRTGGVTPSALGATKQSVAATPAALSSNGSSFAVSWITNGLRG